MLSSFRNRCTLLFAVLTRLAMFYESVPLGDANEGGCTEISEVLRLKKGVVIWTCLFQSTQQIHPNGTSGKSIVCPSTRPRPVFRKALDCLVVRPRRRTRPYPHERFCERERRRSWSGKGGAQRRSAQAQRGRLLGNPLRRARAEPSARFGFLIRVHPARRNCQGRVAAGTGRCGGKRRTRSGRSAGGDPSRYKAIAMGLGNDR